MAGGRAATRDLVVRPRLVTRLHGRWQRRVVAVVAGAGFGKTTLLTQAVEENALSPRGLDVPFGLGPGEVTLRIAAERLRDAGLVAGEPVHDPATLAEAVVEGVWSRSPLEVALVVDDLHAYDEDHPVRALVHRLARALPGNGHLVVASRPPLDLPLARDAAQDAIAVVDEDELRFRDEEMHAFAALRGIEVGELRETAGWPALAELVASAGRHGSEHFLWEEVLDHLDDDLRVTLATLVAVGGADEDLLRACLPADRPVVDLDRLAASVPMLRERSPGWFVPHRLWEPVSAPLLAPVETEEVRRRAAKALRARGDEERAVELLVAVSDWGELASIVVGACGAGHAPLTADTATRWFELLRHRDPDAPETALLEAMVTRAHDPSAETAIKPLERAIAGFCEADDVAGEVAALGQRAYLAWLHDDAEALGRVVGRVLELEAAGADEAKTLAKLAHLGLAEMSGDDEAVLAAAGQLDGDTLSDGWRAVVEWFACRALILLGRAREAVPHAAEVARLGGDAFVAARIAPLWALFYAGEPLVALERRAEVEAAPDDLARYRATVATSFAFGTAYVGRLDEAREALGEARRAVGRSRRSEPGRSLSIAEASVAVIEGDEGRAADSLRAAVDAEALASTGVERQYRMHLALVEVLVPELRPIWDEKELGPDLAHARDLAHALIAIRDAGDFDPVRTLEWREPGFVLAHLPLPWAVELAVAGHAAGVTAGTNLLQWFLEHGEGAARTALRRASEHVVEPVARAARSMLAELPVPPARPLEISVLGPLELRRGGEAVDEPDWRRERVRALLMYLVDRRSATREEVATALWPDLDSEASGRNLRTTLNYLHGVLEPERGPGEAPFVIRTEGPRLRLAAGDHARVDAWDFERLLAQAREADDTGTPSVALGHLQEAVDLWRGDYLADAPYEDWAQPRRDTLRSRFVEAAVRAGELLLAQRAYDDALDLATRAVEADEWSEPAHRLLTAVHLGRGDRAAARRSVGRCRAVLEDLGMPPEPETEMMERLVEEPELHPAERLA